ncbi:hypothetical protein RF11_08483 [Thelohanellus kitauei]|uniref:Uncharacterized protein n=1 Tax=Thelohanellus kitauei TaxID=669202 RepID=A0A0C2NCW4_THEKT|nr:hypothetical protein RF11_08483 [Thelohanellus kitauei]
MAKRDSKAKFLNDVRPTFQFDSFNDKQESWNIYIQRFEHTVKMQGLVLTGEELDELKKDLLLNNLGCTHLKTIVDHVGAIGSKTTTYSKIVSYMATRHQEKINVFYERFNFGNRSRRGNETIMEFLGALKEFVSELRFRRSS